MVQNPVTDPVRDEKILLSRHCITFFQQSRRSDTDGEDDNECHKCRGNALLSVISASGSRPAAGRHDPGLAAAAGATLALKATRLLKGADQTHVTDSQDDERHEQSEQRRQQTVDEVQLGPVTQDCANRLHTHTQCHSFYSEETVHVIKLQ